jgi:hypothetical protein
MTYQATLHIPTDIAQRVSGKYIEIINEITGEVQKYRETVYNLSEAHHVQIKYNKSNEQFIISGLETNVDKVLKKLKEIAQEKKDEYLEYKERKRQQKLNHQEYLLRRKRRELYNQIKEAESGKQQTKIENKREPVILDKNNSFYMLNVEDSDDQYFQRVELKKTYEENKKICAKKISSLLSKLNVMKTKLDSMPTQKKLETLQLSEADIKKRLDDRQKYEFEIDETKLQLEKLQRENELTFEEYEDQLNDVKPDQEVNDITNENSENEEDIRIEIEVDHKTSEPVFNELYDVEHKTFEPISDEARDNEIEDSISQNSVPRNRSSYLKKQYKNKEDNTSKSGSWTYVTNGGKVRTNYPDKKRHFNPGPRHHNRNPNKFDKQDFNEELEISDIVTNRRIPTDNFKDLLGEITGENYLSEFPPLVSK